MIIESIRTKFDLLEPLMTERLRRQWAACEAQSLGRGGVSWVAQATGLSRTTITAGQQDLQRRRDHPATDLEPQRVRLAGAGRPPLTQTDATLVNHLKALVEATTRGEPQSPLLWTCKSTRRLAREVRQQGHQVSHATVATILDQLHYSLQANRKTQEGRQHPDRDAQFQHINERVKDFQRRGQPVISVDTKNKELVGDFKQKGREWHPRGQPEQVRTKDFPDRHDPQQRKVTPEGVYDLTRDEGWVSVGIDHNTAELAGETIRRWWQMHGIRASIRRRASC